MTRTVILALIILAGFALTGALLAWPRDRWELTGGGLEIGGRSSSIEVEYSTHGLLRYLTVIELRRGSVQPPLPTFELDPLRTLMTGVLVVAIWAAIAGRVFKRHAMPANRLIASPS